MHPSDKLIILISEKKTFQDDLGKRSNYTQSALPHLIHEQLEVDNFGAPRGARGMVPGHIAEDPVLFNLLQM